MDEKEVLTEKNFPVLQHNGKDFSLLDPNEKTKIRDCAKWNFYCQTCKTCNYKLICADQWKIREWVNPNPTKSTLNEILKPYELKLVLTELDNNIEHEPEKLVDIANNIALSNVSLEIIKTGIPRIKTIDQETGREFSLEDLKIILQRLAGMKIEFNVKGE